MPDAAGHSTPSATASPALPSPTKAASDQCAKQFEPDPTTNLGYCAAFAKVAGDREFFVAWDRGLEPATITVVDFSGAEPVVRISKRAELLGNLIDVAVTPDGDKVNTPSRAPYEFDERSLSTISRDGVVYPGSPYPNSVSISEVRQGLVATSERRSSAESLAEYELGQPVPIAKMLNVGMNHNLLYPRGLAFSRDGATVFAVTGVALDGTTPSVTLNVIPGPTLP